MPIWAKPVLLRAGAKNEKAHLLLWKRENADAVMTMNQTDGNGRFNLPETAQIYATLAVCEDTEEASEVLQAQGLEISARRLGYYQRHGAHRIKQMRESGLAAQLVGQQARHMSRIKRMDQFSEWIEQQMMGPEGPSELLDRERAAIIHRYRELMATLIQSDSPEGATDQDEEVEPQYQQQVRRGLSLLELISDGREPDEMFEQLILDATRRVAAASGATFPPSGADKSPLESTDPTIRATAGAPRRVHHQSALPGPER